MAVESEEAFMKRNKERYFIYAETEFYAGNGDAVLVPFVENEGLKIVKRKRIPTPNQNRSGDSFFNMINSMFQSTPPESKTMKKVYPIYLLLTTQKFS